ncbi:maltose-binding periplasmic protein [Longilinea arvoryzae]|uniref:Maltose-binding periplasmic protein n=1 Tax=Longilinea arvoryzae TaxID=360412 RepID=A0A0S7BKS6_9CHLR|nr:extracellular solute-binding protein [Longilinea arvoryzae]GAP14433.1 maltose-binding periplasmic protein [Longilinea arvoryzae]
MSKKFLTLISVMLIAVFVLVACGPAATPTAAVEPTSAPEATKAPAATEAPTVAPTEPTVKGNVVIWHSKKTEETNSLNAIIAGFKVLYPDVNVQALFVPDNDLRNKFETAVGSGSGPTILIGAADWGPASFNAQLVQDLTPMLTAGLLDTLNDAAVASVKYKDAVIGLPINLKGVVMYRNSSIVAEPAKDLADLLVKAKAANKGDVVGLDFETGFFFAAGHLAAMGGKLMDPNTGEPTFNDATGAAWLAAIKSVKTAGFPVENNNDNDVNLFKAGKAGVIIDGTWNAKALSDAIGADKLVIDPWPAGMSGYVQNDNIYLTTTAAGDDAIASEKFMEYFVSKEAQAMWADVGTTIPMAGGIPVIKGMEVSDPVEKMEVAAFAGGTAFPVIPQMGAYWDPMNNAILSVLDKGTDPAAALQTAFDAVKEAVAKIQ